MLQYSSIVTLRVKSGRARNLIDFALPGGFTENRMRATAAAFEASGAKGPSARAGATVTADGTVDDDGADI
jgi:hypothetical protein